MVKVVPWPISVSRSPNSVFAVADPTVLPVLPIGQLLCRVVEGNGNGGRAGQRIYPGFTIFHCQCGEASKCMTGCEEDFFVDMPFRRKIRCF